MEITKMDMMIQLIHTLDSESASSETKLGDIKFYRDNGVITADEAIDLVTAYDIRKAREVEA